MVFLDMDNTLAIFSYGKFDDERAKKASVEPGFFRNLKPMAFIWVYAILNMFVPVYIVSACMDTPWCRPEKREWLRQYMPWIPDERIIFVPLGADKAKYVEERIGRPIDKHCFLVDDYGRNLIEWEAAGGTPVKKSMNKSKQRDIPVVYSHWQIFQVIRSTAL